MYDVQEQHEININMQIKFRAENLDPECDHTEAETSLWVRVPVANRAGRASSRQLPQWDLGQHNEERNLAQKKTDTTLPKNYNTNTQQAQFHFFSPIDKKLKAWNM